ncbi:hypothetical protein AVEN_107460-1 [Araneus ventricosus]|uniref:Uncharacterized protein n=1 Tax=Araneus ventricosus TaxID=182803 RepID=A0A4Y2G818_ARAVE|nr:hypothetical protein AVEN_107460-1 [Araneus ventricosus]
MVALLYGPIVDDSLNPCNEGGGLRIYCYSHGKSLPSNAGLMVGKRVLQGEAWSDLSGSRGTHDLGDHFGDLATSLATLATSLATLATNRVFPKMQPFSRYFY